MILRRISKHVKDQNWFAVGIDFFIVLAGILIAFRITNWSQDQTERAELARTEIALQDDLSRNYFNAAERISLTDCRTAQLRDLADRLLAPGEDWEGMARRDTNDPLRAIDSVLRSPSRQWGSRIWQAGLARGTFNQMEAERRRELDLLFQQTEHTNSLEEDIQTLQARLKVLGRTTVLSRTDRLRYFDIISEIDEKSVFLELIAGQIIDQIEQIGIHVENARKLELRDILAETNTRRKDVYGTCTKPIIFPFIEETETEATP